MADLPTDTTSHTTTDITANTIQNLRQEAFVVLVRLQIDDTLYTNWYN
jgi:hypothetical protein